MINLDTAISNKIAYERAIREIDSSDFARALDISEEELTAIEDGKESIPASLAFLAANILGLDLDNLFSTDPVTPKFINV